MLGTQTPKGPTPRRGPTAAEAIAAQTSKGTPSQKRVITEAEMLGTQTPKGPTPRRGPTATKAIAAQTSKAPPKNKAPTAAEHIAAQTSKAPPKSKAPTAAEAIAAQTSKAPPKSKAPTAAEAIAARTSKAKPPPQTPLPWPKNPRSVQSPSSTAAASAAAAAAPSSTTVPNTLHLAEPNTIYDAFKSYLFKYYDNMNASELIGALNDLNIRNIGYLFDEKFEKEVIGKKTHINSATYTSVKELVESQETIDVAKAYSNNKLREMKAQPASPASSSGKKGKGLTRIITKAKAKPKAKSRAANKEIVYVQQPMTQSMPQYRQQPVYAPVPQPQPQPQPQQQTQPVATGSGKHRRQKAVSRLKPIQEEDEEIRTVIKPAKQHLTSYRRFQ